VVLYNHDLAPLIKGASGSRVGKGTTVPDLDAAKRLVLARSWGRCEGCGKFGLRLDVHHRQARQAGGVSGEAEVLANSPPNLLALCRSCHDETEHHETWELTEGIGWRIPKFVTDPWSVPARIHTVNGYAWWQLTKEAGYRWIDFPPEGWLSFSADGYELRRETSLLAVTDPWSGILSRSSSAFEPIR
jgi:hypothetical protein